MSKKKLGRTVKVFDESVVVHSPYSTRTVVADIVGREVDSFGREVIYLNSLIHTPKDNFEGFEAAGCVSTVLTRDLRSDELGA